MNNFDYFISKVLKFEGGFSNDPDDRGGVTNYGITAKTLQTYINDVEDRDYACGLEEAEERVVDITQQDVLSIYEMYYWDVVKADLLPKGVDVYVADWAVNSGPKSAVIALQTTVGTARDGIVGPVTLSAINSVRADRVLFDLFIARLRLYRELSDINNNRKFIKGWNNRAVHLYNSLLEEFFI